eukprot:Opistho-2@57914
MMVCACSSLSLSVAESNNLQTLCPAPPSLGWFVFRAMGLCWIILCFLHACVVSAFCMSCQRSKLWSFLSVTLSLSCVLFALLPLSAALRVFIFPLSSQPHFYLFIRRLRNRGGSSSPHTAPTVHALRPHAHKHSLVLHIHSHTHTHTHTHTYTPNTTLY